MGEINLQLARIKAFRNMKKYSQEKMAELLGIEQTTYSNWETGKVDLTLKNIERIATVLGIPVTDIWDDSKFQRRYVPEEKRFKQNVLAEEESDYSNQVKALRDEVQSLKDLNKTLQRALNELMDKKTAKK